MSRCAELQHTVHVLATTTPKLNENGEVFSEKYEQEQAGIYTE